MISFTWFVFFNYIFVYLSLFKERHKRWSQKTFMFTSRCYLLQNEDVVALPYRCRKENIISFIRCCPSLIDVSFPEVPNYSALLSGASDSVMFTVLSIKPARVSLSLIGCPIHSALFRILAKSLVNYYSALLYEGQLSSDKNSFLFESHSSSACFSSYQFWPVTCKPCLRRFFYTTAMLRVMGVTASHSMWLLKSKKKKNPYERIRRFFLMIYLF